MGFWQGNGAAATAAAQPPSLLLLLLLLLSLPLTFVVAFNSQPLGYVGSDRFFQNQSVPTPVAPLQVRATAVDAPTAAVDWEAVAAELDTKSPLEIMDHVSLRGACRCRMAHEGFTTCILGLGSQA